MSADKKEWKLFHADSETGWTVDVIGFGKDTKRVGEARFSRHGVKMFNVEVGHEEIAMFISRRFDLIERWLTTHTREI